MCSLLVSLNFISDLDRRKNAPLVDKKFFAPQLFTLLTIFLNFINFLMSAILRNYVLRFVETNFTCGMKHLLKMYAIRICLSFLI